MNHHKPFAGKCDVKYTPSHRTQHFCVGCRFERTLVALGPPETFRDHLNRQIEKGVESVMDSDVGMKESDQPNKVKKHDKLKGIVLCYMFSIP